MEIILNWFNDSGYRILITIGAALVVYLVFRIAGGRIIKTLTHVKFVKGERTIKGTEARIKTLSKVFYKTGAFVIFVVVILMILSDLGINVTPVLAGAGVLGLAVGFGAQNLVRDFLNGFFILLEDQFVEGDFVKIKDLAGTVEDFNLRRTVLRDYKGYLHIIPNGEIKTTTNQTYGWSRIVVDIKIPYKHDTEMMLKLMEKISSNFSKDKKYKDLLIEPAQVLGIEKFVAQGYVVNVVFKTKPQRQWDMKRMFLKEVILAFNKEGIDITMRRGAATKKK